MYVSSIWRVQPERCTCSTWVVVRVCAQCACTCAVFSMGSLSDAPIMRSLHGGPVVRERCGTCCTCACAVFDMDCLSGAPNARGYACVGVHTVRVPVQCSAWTA